MIGFIFKAVWCPQHWLNQDRGLFYIHKLWKWQEKLSNHDLHCINGKKSCFVFQHQRRSILTPIYWCKISMHKTHFLDETNILESGISSPVTKTLSETTLWRHLHGNFETTLGHSSYFATGLQSDPSFEFKNHLFVSSLSVISIARTADAVHVSLYQWLTLHVMIRVFQFFRISQLCH